MPNPFERLLSRVARDAFGVSTNQKGQVVIQGSTPSNGQGPIQQLIPSQSFPGAYRVEHARIVPVYKAQIGEFTPFTFQSAVTAYRTDGDIFHAINWLASAALSPGFYVTGDEKYKNGRALDLIKDFNEHILWGGNVYSQRGLWSLMQNFALEMLYGGNTFLEMISPESLHKLNQVQIATIWKFNRDVFGNVYAITQKVGGQPFELDPETIIHIPFITVNREAQGVGIIEPLLQPTINSHGQNVPPFYVLKASLVQDIARLIHSRGVQREYWWFPDAGDEELDKYRETLSDPDIDARLVGNISAELVTEKGSPAQGLKALIDYVNDRYQVTLGPINKLITQAGFTEASSRVSKELEQFVITDLQMKIQNAVENELYQRVLVQAGYDPVEAEIKLHWGVPEKPKLAFKDVIDMFDRGAVTPVEFRRFIRDSGGIELDDDSEWIASSDKTGVFARGQVIATPGGVQPAIGVSVNPAKQAQAQGITPATSPQRLNPLMEAIQSRVFRDMANENPHRTKFAHYEQVEVTGRANWKLHDRKKEDPAR